MLARGQHLPCTWSSRALTTPYSDYSVRMLAAQARATAEAWEKRARQLQQKYGKVDLEEHQKLQAELVAARERAEALQATLTAKEAELAQVPAQ